ncbi:hypothetical protein SORBI_3003G080100 [Sorghum bicolor]|uniref:Protein kinase domain-containing protein n=1 Tax=Sorghum bicolor TaxID=4558 RepID=A0A1W0VW88_SORBI|nr:hypothetical protein SORBI_3003G080100 [Sorghum bicolor]
MRPECERFNNIYNHPSVFVLRKAPSSKLSAMAQLVPSSLLLFLLVSSSVWVASDGQGGDHCPPQLCGNVTISFPFGLIPDGAAQTDCGAEIGFEVSCSDSNVAYLGSFQSEQDMQILSIFYHNQSLLVADRHWPAYFNTSSRGRCRAFPAKTSSRLVRPFSISSVNQNLIFYNCDKPPPPPSPSSPGVDLVETVCHQAHNNTFVRAAADDGGGSDESSEGSYSLEGCTAAMVPVLGMSGEVNASNYQQLVWDGFLATWQLPPPPSSGGKRSHGKTILIATASLLFPCIYLLVFHQRGQRLWFLLGRKGSSSTERNIEALIESYGSLAPKRYNYSELMKITSFLNHKLGEGGYGMVYKGRLLDGRLVAVKFLHDCKGQGDEFVNEVMSIGRTSHVNIVSLFGFCLERSKRALIYEYMPNGSLDQYIYCENPKDILGWQNLYIIAIGIARGLEYLHHNCNTRIVHFDIKPQNILLDQDFCPKIADFGLAKLCHTRESKFSMTETRGTIGFIAPEVHSRAFGVVSTKSDVYSYGMMLLEMIGGRKNVKSIVEKSSQKYFPDWIYDHFSHDDGLEACEVTCEVEEIARKMILIGLWCVQVLPTSRPTITKVLEMFERGLDELDMPPKQDFNQIPEESLHILNTETTSFSSFMQTQAFSEVLKIKQISTMNSKNLQRLPTL